VNPHEQTVEARRAAARQDFDPTTEEFDPHPPGWPMKAAIAIAMVLSILAAVPYFLKTGAGAEHGGWVGAMVHNSSAHSERTAHEGFNFLGITDYKSMYVISALVGFIGILIAAYLHGPKGWQGLFIGNRTAAATAPRADRLVTLFGALTRAARNKYYVDEIYDAIIRTPLLVVSHVFHMLDRLLVDGLVNAAGWLPGALGKSLRPAQSGRMHSYAVGMATGAAALLLLVLVMVLA
jgi:NADH-quinone oxidoreductase subunit L